MKTSMEFDNYRQEQALEDYIETTVMLQYNSK